MAGDIPRRLKTELKPFLFHKIIFLLNNPQIPNFLLVLHKYLRLKNRLIELLRYTIIHNHHKPLTTFKYHLSQ